MRNKWTKNFSVKEFACKGVNCCKQSAPIHITLVRCLQRLRDICESPIKVHSGFRCKRHNFKIGGAKKSYHTLGLAVDISCKRFPPKKLAEIANNVLDFRYGGIGTYKSWVHLDIRGILGDMPARWSK